ncbi:MAG: helix-turn-helix domain-containing protein [Candidatus Heimdallarchaeota archaeon]|nr:MAG: helix-turn-helix domain-containing protein [Candidatus Heimdallarchaeota archaeon]
MLYNALVKVIHDCPFSRLSNKFPMVEVLHWCNSHYDVLELRGTKDKVTHAISEVHTNLGSIIKKSLDQNHVQMVIKQCECDYEPFSVILDTHKCIQLPPVKYLAGEEVVKLLITLDDLKLVTDELKEKDPEAKIEILNLAPVKEIDNPKFHLLYLDELRTDLTVKQLHALTKAFNQGYYELPRNVSIDSLSEEMAIKPRTFQEHLRKAERKIMKKIVPVLNFK